MPINDGFSLSALWTRIVSRRVSTEKHHCHCTVSTSIPDKDFVHSTIIPDDALSNDIAVTMIHIGETLLYIKGNHRSYVKVQEAFLDDKNVMRFWVTDPDGLIIETTREFLHDPLKPDIAWIPSTVPEMRNSADHLEDTQLESLMNPVKLSPLQEEWLALHERLWHLPFSIMFRLAKAGFLNKKFLKLRNEAPPCVSCMFGQAHRRPWRSKSSADGGNSTLRGPKLSAPGQTVGIDHLVSAQPGLVPQNKGTLTRARVWAASVFVDYVTKFVYVALMTDQSAEASVEAKHAFEHFCGTRNVEVKHYHADNGVFGDSLFMEDIKKSMQRISFCGVNAHHQNGITERMIKSLTLISRTLLLHAQRHWPEYITTMLWPLALKAAQDRLNQLSLDLDGKTPDMKFSDVAAATLRLRDFHTWGCPCYILDSRLQSNPKAIPKWEPRSRLGIYVGRSPHHAGNVSLVLNPITGLVSPQFHVVFDDDFTTVPHLRKGTVPHNWAKLVQFSSEKSTETFVDLTKTYFEGAPDEAADELVDLNPSLPSASPIVDEGDTPINFFSEGVIPSSPLPNEGGTPPPPVNEEIHLVPIVSQSQDDEGENYTMPEMINLESAGLRRSPRIAENKKKNGMSFTSIITKLCAFGFILATTFQPTTVFSHAQASVNSVIHKCDIVNANFDGTLNEIHHMVFAAGKENNKCFTYQEMLKQEDAKDFISAMLKETKEHESRRHWDVVKKSSMPAGTKPIQAIWSFKRKRFPDGSLNKHKARLCAHGGMQQWGVNYWETYAPVVNWICVRFLLILSEVLQLETRAINFVLAFPQADLDVPVFMHLPAGMIISGVPDGESTSYVLKLRKSLYGLKQASANWHDLLKTSLVSRGFKESVADPCVFIRKDMIVLVYVDDCILISRKSDVIDEFILSLIEGPEKFAFTDEGDLRRYLGVEIKALDDGNGFCMSQPFLIERILQAAEIDTRMTNSRPTPAVLPLLGKDTQGPDRKHDWKYRTLTGMLGYLQGTSRPEIAMSTHQCARFNNYPKLSHERAIKRICKYLLGTMDKGLIFRPDTSRGLECYVDADFAGGWATGDHENPECVLSRTGFVIMYAGCPVTWSSKLQTEIALSTTEAEYIALSQAMREVIPFLNLIKEIHDVLPIERTSPKIFCKVFEDNQSCIKVAESPKFTHRTKHISLKYHHFRQYVADGTIKIEPIDTREQIADIFTKPLDEKQFSYLRKKLSGW